MVSILVSILVAVVVVGVAYAILQVVPLPEPFKRIGLAVLLLILLVWICAIVGLFGGGWRGHLG